MSVVIPGQESHNSVLSVIPVTPRWVWSTPVQAEVPFIVKGDPLIQGQALPAPQYCFIFRWWSPLVAGKKDMVSFMRACLLGSLLVMFLIISLNCRPSDFCFRRTKGDCRLHPGACQQGGQASASGLCLREGLFSFCMSSNLLREPFCFLTTTMRTRGYQTVGLFVCTCFIIPNSTSRTNCLFTSSCQWTGTGPWLECR